MREAIDLGGARRKTHASGLQERGRKEKLEEYKPLTALHPQSYHAKKPPIKKTHSFCLMILSDVRSAPIALWT